MVTFGLANGTTVSQRVDHPRGHSLRGGPTWSELAAKWRDALPDADTDAWVDAAAELDQVEDSTTFLALFARIPARV